MFYYLIFSIFNKGLYVLIIQIYLLAFNLYCMKTRVSLAVWFYRETCQKYTEGNDDKQVSDRKERL